VGIRRVVPDITADDPATCEAFYADVLGFQRAMDLGWIVTYISPTNPTAQISLVRRGEAAAPQPALTVEVDTPTELERAHSEAVARGYAVVYPLTDEPWGVRRFFLRDPNGVVVNVMCHTAAPPAR
jgi:catechol 2,3-dioxygenase-like lactoylglutathione lyase family enzyme